MEKADLVPVVERLARIETLLSRIEHDIREAHNDHEQRIRALERSKQYVIGVAAAVAAMASLLASAIKQKLFGL